jgi:16S rRNA processing protein RimM
VSAESDRVVQLGQISGVHGIQGWVKLLSFTEPRTNLLEYPVWCLDHGDRSRSVRVEKAQQSGKRLIAKLEGVDDRDAAAELIGAAIGVRRSALPPLEPGEYYWADLEGLSIINLAGDRLGRVGRILPTGANDVLVLEGGERMIPFITGQVVKRVDLDAGEIVVDWDASFWE